LEKIKNLEVLLKKDFSDKKIGFMGSKSFIKAFDQNFGISLGDGNDFNQIASNLFRALRSFDDNDIDIVISEAFELIGVGHAIMNRLRKSAGYKTIDLKK
jgi:L-threonylcarbamoyladenylate synthase